MPDLKNIWFYEKTFTNPFIFFQTFNQTRVFLPNWSFAIKQEFDLSKIVFSEHIVDQNFKAFFC